MQLLLAIIIASGRRDSNPLPQDGILALCRVSYCRVRRRPDGTAAVSGLSRWWRTPAYRARGGFLLAGCASAAASAVYARPSCHVHGWSGRRDSNPLPLLGRQKLYLLSYCRFMWLLSSGLLTPAGETFSRSVSRSPCTVRICAARTAPETLSRVVVRCFRPPFVGVGGCSLAGRRALPLAAGASVCGRAAAIRLRPRPPCRLMFR